MEEQLKLHTAGAAEFSLAIAGVGSRSYAFIIDWHIRFILALAWVLIVALVVSMMSPEARFFEGFFSALWKHPKITWIGAALIYLAYHPLLEVLMSGRTPGKRMAGVRIVSITGQTPTVGALLIRNVFRLIDSLPLFYILGLGVALFNQRNVRIGDIAAGTLLVFENKTAHIKSQLTTHVGQADLELLNDIVERWPSLGRAARQRLALKYLEKTGEVLTTAEETDERVLHARLKHILTISKSDQPAPTALVTWLKSRQAIWENLRSLLKLEHATGALKVEEAKGLIRGFRGLLRDVSLARSTIPSSRLTGQLEALLVETHDTIYRAPSNLRQDLMQLMRKEVPEVVASLRGAIVATSGLFLGSAIAGWLLVYTYPELASLFASEEMINTVQRGELWTDGLLNIMPSAWLSLSIMTNNILVTLFAFVLGALYGLGTIYIVTLNGLMLGAAFAFTAQYDLDGKLLKFIVAHGVVELSIVCLAAAADIQLGEALARPGKCTTRAEAFRAAVARAGKLLPVCALFLVGAGLIEGYISPNDNYDLKVRIAIGIGYGILMWLVLSGRIWRGKISVV